MRSIYGVAVGVKWTDRGYKILFDGIEATEEAYPTESEAWEAAIPFLEADTGLYAN